MRRRRYVTSLVGGAAVTISGCFIDGDEGSDDEGGGGNGTDGGTKTETDEADPWLIASLPDTQNYATREERIEITRSQADWIVDNHDSENIAFAVHKGDVVGDGSEDDQWERMESVLGRLDGTVPYAVAIGDHDYSVDEDRTSGAANYRDYFGASRFEEREYFGGVGPHDRSHYQYFSGGGYDFIHVDLEWEAPGDPSDPESPIGWATAVLEDHADLPAIITTHAYLTDEDGGMRSEHIEEVNEIGNSGREIWEKLIRPNPNVFMVLGADYFATESGEYHQVATNAAGSDVYEMLANYQHYPEGGNGWFRHIRFVPGGGTSAPDRIEIETYSSWLDEYQTDPKSDFHFDLDFEQRFDP